MRSLVAWLAVAAVTIAAGLLTVGLERARLQPNHAAARSAAGSGVELSVALSLRQENVGTSLVVAITITNSGDIPQPFIGAACYDPAAVSVRSTRAYPSGPAYSRSAEALRTKVLDNERTRDEVASFTDDGGDAPSAGC